MATKTFNISAHEATLDRIIAETFSASFMSNSKWRKLFHALTSSELQIEQLVWKFVGRDLAVRGAAPDAGCLGESRITDTSFSAFSYREIEWIEIPPTSIPAGSEGVPFKHRPQKVAQAQDALAPVGQLETALSPNGLRVYGYR